MVITIIVFLCLAGLCGLIVVQDRQIRTISQQSKDLRIDMNVCQSGQNSCRTQLNQLDKLCRDTEQSRFIGQKDLNDRIAPIERHIAEEKTDRTQIVERLDLVEKEYLTEKPAKPQTGGTGRKGGWIRTKSLIERASEDVTT